MEKEFVEYELALRMKALGFDEKCYGYFTKDEEFFYFDVDDLSSAYTKNMDNLVVNSVNGLECTAPLYQQAFRWFREKYELYSWVQLHNGYIGDSFYKKLPITWTVMGHESGKQYYERDIDHNYLYNTHEEAEVACLTKLIEIVEFKKE